MASLDEIRDGRLAKIERLKQAGMDPYPASVPHDMMIAEAMHNFTELEQEEQPISLAGRIMAIRGSGAIMFIVLREANHDFQAVLKKDEIDESHFALFQDTVDIGDWISVTGPLFTTQKGQESILIQNWHMASKSLLPLPEKWAGLSDDEERLRKRYLEIISDPSVYDRFRLRSRIISAIRTFFDELDFMEIETPILQSQAGGAMAETFDTHHNDYDMDMVLRIALELEHKILIAAGYPRVYEIGKNFRNEGSDPTHIQEFTMIEWYASFATLEENMTWTEELLKQLATKIMGKTTFTVFDKDNNEMMVDFAGEWPRVKFSDLIKENTGLDISSASDNEIKTTAIHLGMDPAEAAKTGRGNLLDFVFKKSSRHKIINPTFVMDYPGSLKPLAKQKPDGTAHVSQLVLAGAEITNKYGELIDPVVQRQLLEAQAAAKDAGDAEAMQVDERFLTAMEHGMPPMTGGAIGIDRLVAIFTEQKNLRETIFFPIMKPKGE